MVNHQQSFDHFMERREAAAAAYVKGDAQPLDRIIVRGLPASFFAPTGGYVTGADKVARKYGNDATQFGLNGGSCFEVFDAAAGAEIANWTGIQHAKVQMGGHSELQQIDIRVTEVFRREGGEWKLAHRHADTLSSRSLA